MHKLQLDDSSEGRNKGRAFDMTHENCHQHGHSSKHVEEMERQPTPVAEATSSSFTSPSSTLSTAPSSPDPALVETPAGSRLYLKPEFIPPKAIVPSNSWLPTKATTQESEPNSYAIKPPEHVFRCLKCSYRTTKATHIEAHENAVHVSAYYERKPEEFVCEWPECNFRSQQRGKVDDHWFQTHTHHCFFPGCDFADYDQDSIQTHFRLCHMWQWILKSHGPM